jgi:hypothetical protein
VNGKNTRRSARFALLAIATLCRSVFGADNPPAQPGMYAGGDGLSIAGAVLITGGDDISATRAEYAWLKEHVPGAKVTRQSVVVDRGPLLDKILDKLEVTLADGSERVYFFDISRTYGKTQ